MSVTLDVGPVMVRGAVTAHRARVLWADGTLYVVHSPTRVTTIETTEPERTKDTWRAETINPGGSVSFTRPGCSTCGYRLGRLSQEEILASG